MTDLRDSHGQAPAGHSALGRALHLVTIAGTGTDAPIYCIHPSGGTVFCYVALARLLGPRQQVFGLQVAERDSDGHVHRSVEEMASCYLEAMNWKTPAILLAWSFGGAVAFEIARMAELRAAPPTELILLDTPGPGFVPPARSDVEVLCGLLRNRAPARPEDISAVGDPAAQFEHLVGLCRAARIYDTAVSTAELQRLIAIHQRNNEAARAYKPRSFGGRLTLLRPTGDSIFSGATSDPTLGWSSVVNGGVDLSFVPGGHLEMLSTPNVTVLAERVRHSIDAPMRTG